MPHLHNKPLEKTLSARISSMSTKAVHASLSATNIPCDRRKPFTDFSLCPKGYAIPSLPLPLPLPKDWPKRSPKPKTSQVLPQTSATTLESSEDETEVRPHLDCCNPPPPKEVSAGLFCHPFGNWPNMDPSLDPSSDHDLKKKSAKGKKETGPKAPPFGTVLAKNGTSLQKFEKFVRLVLDNAKENCKNRCPKKAESPIKAFLLRATRDQSVWRYSPEVTFLRESTPTPEPLTRSLMVQEILRQSTAINEAETETDESEEEEEAEDAEEDEEEEEVDESDEADEE